MQVGDRVEFQIGEEIFEDVITYIGEGVIEGEKFDLTHVKFKVIEK